MGSSCSKTPHVKEVNSSNHWDYVKIHQQRNVKEVNSSNLGDYEKIHQPRNAKDVSSSNHREYEKIYLQGNVKEVNCSNLGDYENHTEYEKIHQQRNAKEVNSSNLRDYEKIHQQSPLRNKEHQKIIDNFQLLSPNCNWPELNILHYKLQQDQAKKTGSQKSSTSRELNEDLVQTWESINTSELMQGLEDQGGIQGEKIDQDAIKKSVCGACGGLSLFPCVTCNGSCKILEEGKTPEGSYSVSRCPDCNEDGLIQCPLCCNSRSISSSSPGDQ